MSFKKILFAAVLMTGMLMGPQVYADEGTGKSMGKWGQWGEWREKKTQEIYNQLGLTDEQKKKLEENKLNNKDQRKSLYEKARDFKASLRQELMKPALDMNKINEIQAQIKANQAQITDDRFNSVLEVRKILTSEQFSKFITLSEESKHEKRE